MSEQPRYEPRSVFREYLEALLIAAVFLGFTNTFVVKTFYIPSGSMKDTLLIGDHLFVNRYIFGQGFKLERKITPQREIRRGDIVIFRSPESPTTDLVKRCIGVPGDEIRVVDKKLHVNGQEVDDTAFASNRDPQLFKRRMFSRQQRLRDNFGPITVPDDEYFFLGDNRDHSYDSRFWGTVPRHYIKGRALMVYWSFGGETSDGQWRSWSDKVAQVGRTAAGFVTKTRWKRSFHLIR